jgi:type III restriction enzyme
VHFNLDYVNADGNISNYYPDFVVKTTDGLVTIVETKGEEDMDVPLKMARLKQWCEDINSIQKESHFDFVFVDEEAFHDYSPRDFVELKKTFVRYKE